MQYGSSKEIATLLPRDIGIVEDQQSKRLLCLCCSHQRDISNEWTDSIIVLRQFDDGLKPQLISREENWAARPVWVLPSDATIAVDFSTRQTIETNVAKTSSALVLSDRGNLYLPFGGVGWIDMGSRELVHNDFIIQNQRTTFPDWRVECIRGKNTIALYTH